MVDIRGDSSLDQSIIRYFEAFLGWEIVATSVAIHGVLHLDRLPPLEGEKNRPDDYLIVAASDHRILEPLTECILALFELVDLLL